MTICVLMLATTATSALHAALDPAASPLIHIPVTSAHRLVLHVPEDDAIMEATMAEAHAAALAAGPDRYDEVMEEHCTAQPQAYWAQLWPSALALGEWVVEEPSLVAQRTVLELGCGLGLGAVCASLAGAADVLATDREEAALVYAAANAAANGCEIATRRLDWAEELAARSQNAPEDVHLSTLRRHDVVLAADVIYDETAPSLLAQLLPSLLADGGTLLLADNADRPYKAARREELLELLTAGGFVVRPAQGDNGAAARTVRVDLRTRQGDDKQIVLTALERN